MNNLLAKWAVKYSKLSRWTTNCIPVYNAMCFFLDIEFTKICHCIKLYATIIHEQHDS